MRTLILAIVVSVLSGCQFIMCGDGPCPRYERCPVEKKKVEVEAEHSEAYHSKCGWFKNFNCLRWTDTLTDEQGHVWQMPGKVNVPGETIERDLL